VLANFPPQRFDPNVLVGLETSDDAAVYRLSEDLAIVSTADFLTPIVDDPKTFGAIAAANALSDIYAMGARPLFALNLVSFPTRRLPIEVLQQILAGAAEVANEAGISIVGGHSIDDTEPKFGWAVTGRVNPGRIVTNKGAKIGDSLILTKPIGGGIIATAAKRGAASDSDVTRSIEVMLELNRAASEVMSASPTNACTDVSGFGLVGHLLEMTTASGVNVELWSNEVPVLSGALEWSTAGLVPGGTKDNLEHVRPLVRWDKDLSMAEKHLLCDAQTSGGLLMSLPQSSAGALISALQNAGATAATEIGRILDTGEGEIRVVRRPR